jgi:hypothetical protein
MYPNYDLWSENKPSGNPGLQTCTRVVLIFGANQLTDLQEFFSSAFLSRSPTVRHLLAFLKKQVEAKERERE